jgi:VWFA-related protein
VRIPATLLAFTAAVAALAAQQPRPTFRTEANFVRVDVYVTRDGAPATDLTAADFELVEDRAPQKIETFEHVVVRPAGPQATRVEPSSQREGNEMAADPRARVFVIFLDTYHVSVDGSHRIRAPLIRLMDSILGPDDLVGLMTPEMSAANLTLGRKTQVIEGALTDNWAWGRRFSIAREDPKERQYHECYSGFVEGEAIVNEMIARRRERFALDSLQDLVRHLRGIREERKAIIAVSDGWVLWRDNPQLARALQPWNPNADPVVPGQPEIYVGQGGKLRAGSDARGSLTGASLYACDAERQALAMMDNDRHLRDILGEANRANASFYPVDPRGLAAFDSPIGPEPPPPPAMDYAILRRRQEALQTLAVGTDGLAVMNTNDLERGLRRVAADLTSYYLLGYYSTNTKLDGAFRSIKVRVRRPGVQVRARRGYRAATLAEIARGSEAPAPPGAESASAAALTGALGRLAGLRPDAPFQLHALVMRAGRGLRVWVIGELDTAVARSPNWAQGGEATLMVSAPGGAGTSARTTILPGERAFAAPVVVEDAGGGPSTGSGQVEVQVEARLRPKAGGDAPPGQMLAAKLARRDGLFLAADPLLFRLGPGAAAVARPAASFRFSRAERVRLEAPLAAAARPAGGRVLDRTGKALDVPVTVTERADGDGVRWLVADFNPASLAPADYAVELAAERDGARETVIAAIRIVR